MTELSGNPAETQRPGRLAVTLTLTLVRGFDARHKVVLGLVLLALSARMLPTASGDLMNETAILLDIKRAWGNPKELSTWSSTSNVCSSWAFVTCDSQNATITQLLIFGAEAISGNATRSLLASIGYLANLQVLTVMDWSLTGEIPSSIARLRNLTLLTLNSNALTGSIPPEIGNLSKLKSLDLGKNNMTGLLPVQLSRLRQLETLTLDQNHFGGTFPSWIGDFPNLVQLNAAYNSFQGSIPPELGNLTHLQILELTSSGVTGAVPSELGKLTALQMMNLDINLLKGNIPETFGNLTSLESLVLTQCAFSGPIPVALMALINLTSVDLGQNQLSGPIPDGFGNLLFLQRLALSQNSLSGTIPTQLGQLSSLQYMDLHQNLLSGSIPMQFSQLKNLSYLDLSSNLLIGQIPQKLTVLPQLQTLTLEDNCLNGTVPSYNMSDPNLLFDFGLNGSRLNCFNASQACKCASLSGTQAPLSPTPSVQPEAGGDNGVSDSAKRVYIAIGVVAGSILALLTLVVLLFWRQRCQSKQPDSVGTYKGPVRQYTLAEVREATKDFTTKIGDGAFANVYKAVFKDDTTAAVKRFNKRKPVESFEQEVELLSHLKHRFLVNLIGYCQDSDVGEHILLYEFMDRGNLHENLHGKRNGPQIPLVPLTWDERVRVLISVAYGIDYLHYGTSPPMIHRDIKSANILLSSSYQTSIGGGTLIAKLADFGLGRHTVIDENEMTSAYGHEPPKPFPTTVAGTPGYFDPEYVHTSVLSPLADVYSYGIVLLELITGKLPIMQERLTLAQWVSSSRPFDILCPVVLPNGLATEVQRCLANLLSSVTFSERIK